MLQHGNSGIGEWWVDAGYIFKLNAIEFPDYWDAGYERKRGVEDDFQDFGLSNGTMALASAEIGKAVSRAGLGARLRIKV